jgi:hypothetical protein
MKRLLAAAGIAFFFASLLGSRSIIGQNSGRHPFVDRSDTGETVHVLPLPASIRSPFDTQPTIAPVRPGLSVYGASYGSGNLVNHGGNQIPSAGFFAIYWNGSVANAGGSGVTSLGYANIQSQISAFAAAFSDGVNYSEGDPAADYTVVQQYGVTDPISAAPLAPALGGLGYYIDAQPTRSSISDSKIRSYLAGLFQSGTVPASPNVIYGIYFPSGMKVTLQGGTSCSSFCGYHGSFMYNGQDIKYASFPYTNCRGCLLAGFAVADMLTIVTSHEVREAVTDPNLDAWFDSAGYEADDKCAWHNLYQTASGGFWVQPEFSNGGSVTASGFTQTYPQLSPTMGGCVVAK